MIFKTSPQNGLFPPVFSGGHGHVSTRMRNIASSGHLLFHGLLGFIEQGGLLLLAGTGLFCPS